MSDDQPNPPSPLSVLRSQARGGHTALGGFDYQLAVLLAYLPGWLARDGFTSLSWELHGDIEARFFSPAHGMVIACVEAKNHTLAAGDFWAEIGHFRALDEATPGTYGRFVLAVADLSEAPTSAVVSLRRVRQAESFYGRASLIGEASYLDWSEMAGVRDRHPDERGFLAERVVVDGRLARGQTAEDAPLARELVTHFPEYGRLSHSELTTIHDRLLAHIRAHRGVAIDRAALLGQIAAVLAPAPPPAARPVTLHTAYQPGEAEGTALHFPWADFFGGAGRDYPPAARWQGEVVGQLAATRAWLREHRPGARLMLTGARRLSPMFAIGAEFPAVGGFALETDHRDQRFATDAHAGPDDDYAVGASPTPARRADELVVSIGIARDIAAEVGEALAPLGLADLPVLHLHGAAPILSPGHANAVARRLKEAIGSALAATGARCVHLFFAGPAFLALFLGHRWNAVAAVQCYEWVGTGRYVPTCAVP